MKCGGKRNKNLMDSNKPEYDKTSVLYMETSVLYMEKPKGLITSEEILEKIPTWIELE